MTIPGLGPVTASAMAASIQDVSTFSGPCEFAAFLGLTPKQNSSGGKERLGRISKMGNRFSRAGFTGDAQKNRRATLKDARTAAYVSTANIPGRASETKSGKVHIHNRTAPMGVSPTSAIVCVR
jgi:transposase